MLSTSLLDTLEKKKILAGTKYIRLDVDKNHSTDIALLLNNQYEIVAINESTYTFEKSFLHLQSLRISLTEKCNYRCVFCHEEGIDMTRSWDSRSDEELFDFLLMAVQRSYNDITFTGGEPLIRWKFIVTFFKRIAEYGLHPAITIVTNAQLINDELVEACKQYPGKIKCNVSLHTPDEENYLLITNPRNVQAKHLEQVYGNIQKMVNAGISTKLNIVVLRGINSSPEQILEIIATAERLGINRIKFLELLITDKLLKFYHYHYSLDSVIHSLKDKLTPISENRRVKTYGFLNKSVVLEFARVHCSLGCENCIYTGELIVNNELQFFPCFFHSNSGLPIDTCDNFEKGIGEGMLTRLENGKEFGHRTPFIVNERGNLQTKTEYQYTVDNADDFIETILKDGYNLIRYREFEEIHFKTSHENTFYKWYKNTYSNRYSEVFKNVSRVENRVDTQYFTIAGAEMSNESAQLEKLYHLGVKQLFAVQWFVKTFKKDDLYISVSTNSRNSFNYVLATCQLETVFNKLQKMNMPLELHLKMHE